MKAVLKDNRTGAIPEKKRTELIWERREKDLRFFFRAEESERFSAYGKDNAPIYQGDVVELFLCVDGDRKRYFEIEIAPNGKTFFAEIFNDGDRIDCNFLERNFEAKVKRTETGYDVEISIPYESVKTEKDKPILFNAYRIETDGGETDKHLFALNPTMCGSFHKPDFFVEL